jgi:hypothetical protein
MEMVFERGHDAHGKWQTWFRDMGILKGSWVCRYCGLHWEDVSPHVCPRCEHGADLIRYAEVPCENKEFLIAGSADGDVVRATDTTLIEIKTIGEGTLRWDAPALIEKHSYRHTDDAGKSHTGVDWYSLWNGIRRPFGPHLRQGMIYCFCLGRPSIIYIYEPKFVTAYPKEFEIKFSRDLIEDRLQQCVIIRNALERGHPPKRPMWAEKTCKTCKNCPFRNTCYGG